MDFDGKAELINGRLVEIMAVGYGPAEIPDNIVQSLRSYVRQTRSGITRSDGVGYIVPTLISGRQSFQPDASYYLGPLPPDDFDFIQGPPTFAVEVRSKHDYGAVAEVQMAEKRADYFEAGTRVVWDVCPQTHEVRKYVPGVESPTLFTLGMLADAEPAVPGWIMSVDDVFEQL
jgi:Uma2 family endonuclease